MKNQWYSITTSHGDEAMCWDGFAIYRDDHDGNDPERFDSDELAAEYPVDALEISRTIEASDWYCDAVADALDRNSGRDADAVKRDVTPAEAARIACLLPLIAALCDTTPERIRLTVSIGPSGNDAWKAEMRTLAGWRIAHVKLRTSVTSVDDHCLDDVAKRVGMIAAEEQRTARRDVDHARATYERLLARADAIDAGIEKASGR